jgi:serine/threonine protein kinase/peptidoglycan hydrolase-like protein with peptidoglycan-binding domain
LSTSPQQADLGALPIGYRLGAFEIVEVIGQGGFGITYRALHTRLGIDAAIKEYMPSSLVVRQADSTIQPRSTKHTDDFVWGQANFVSEGRTLAKFQNTPGIVSVRDFFDQNGTSYIVMDMVHGETLETRLRRGPLSPPEFNRILHPLLTGLEKIHDGGFLHRDIKPANIIIDKEGNPTLIDFGAARAASSGRTTAMTAVFTPGYASLEQMTSAKQGPWTDIYGLAATLYHGITGTAPTNTFDRVVEETYVPLAQLRPEGFDRNVRIAIDAGMALKASDRPQNIAGWKTLFGMSNLGGTSATVRLRESAQTVVMRQPEEISVKTHRFGWKTYTAIGLALLVTAGVSGTVWIVKRPTATKAAVVEYPSEIDNPTNQIREQERKRAREAAEREAKARAEAEAKEIAAREAAAKARAEAEAREAKARAEAEAKARAEAEAKEIAAREAAAKARAEAETRETAEREDGEAKETAAREAAEREAAAAREREIERRVKERLAQEKVVAEAKARADEEAAAEAAAKAKAAENERIKMQREQGENVENALSLSADTRQKIQASLTALGFDTDGADGRFGSKTRREIAKFQRSRKLDDTGFLTADQVKNLLKEAEPALAKLEADRKKAEETKPEKKPEPKIETKPEPSKVAAADTGPEAIYNGTMYCTNRAFSANSWQIDLAMAVRNGHGAGQRQIDTGMGQGSYKFALDISGKTATATWSGIPNNSTQAANGACEVTLTGPVDDQGNINLSMKTTNCGSVSNRGGGSDSGTNCSLKLKKLGNMFK